MRVKRLEIQGFKSFKDKTVIHFDHSITGIVGPNGCGKSNIVDAFFWVMGEQSYKHMRGTSSEDLIFNGSSKYQPLGLAEATMVLENDIDEAIAGPNAPAGASAKDLPLHLRAKEIAVTRRVYRTGEGEYFINGVPARLKDIQELFMDTGVGAKGYSVIEQGQIGKIVNAKPEDRRLLIEEAAGIAKYKKRKQESLRKMEATQANLSRLNDVITEIERSLNSLERQAQKARQYQKYKSELLDKEMTWGRRKTKVLRQKLEAFQSERTAMEQELVGLKASLASVEAGMEADRSAQLMETKLAEDLQTRIQSFSDELTREQSALDLSRRRQGDLATQLAAFAAEKSELENGIATEQRRVDEKSTESQDAQLAHQAASEHALALDAQARAKRAEMDEARTGLESLKRTLMTDIAASSDLTSRSASLLSKAESALAQAEKLNQQSELQLARVADARAETERAQAQAQAVRDKLEIVKNERRAQGETAQSAEQSLRTFERSRDDAQKALTQVRSKLQSLQELALAYEGYSDGAKAALDWARESGAAGLGALADSFEVESGYEAALEGCLEGRIEALISSDEKTALAALNHLAANKLGRASVHVAVPAVGDRAAFGEVRTELESAGFEVEGELSGFVRANSRLGELGAHIAGAIVTGVCVVRSSAPLATFLSLGNVALQRLNGWTVVARDGVALDPSGMLRGGSTESDSTASLLGRKRAITELETQVVSAEASLATEEASVTTARQGLDLSRARLQTLQAEVQGLEVEIAAIDRDVHQSQRSLRDVESQAELIRLEMAEMSDEVERAKSERARIEGDMAEITARRTDLEARIRSGEAELASLEAEVRATDESLNALRVNEAQLKERAISASRELGSARELIADRERRLNEVVRSLERTTDEKSQFTGSDSMLETKIHELTLTLASDRDTLARAKDGLEQTSARLNGALDRIKELHQTGDAKTSQVNGLALEFEKLNAELSHLVQNLEEKYGPGCLELPVTSPIQEEMEAPVVTAEMSAEEEQTLGEDVERLRDRIRRLGEVNVSAVEEYDEVKKRYDHLMTERADLDQSIKNLEDAIEHINKTSVERFKRAFDAIADRFERLFPIIFGGGQAKLSLVWPEGVSQDDILEAGVDILAQPPGKKIVNIQLLSGGEKALTAVSLIFAIFMVKPSPFCVLDEVDAPLDDANIGKFNALLKEMSAKSQFIIITHNKKTMELNDTLYGVTMEEPGVSKMVSIEMH